MNEIKNIYRSFPKEIWTYTIILYIFIARKTIFNVSREIGSFEATVDQGTSLALAAISLSIYVLLKNCRSIKILHKTLLCFSGYYILAFFSFLWADNFGTIVFKSTEVLTNFYLVALIIYKIKNPSLILYYIILISSATTFFDIINCNIRGGIAFIHHTNGYTFTALIALLLSFGSIKHRILKFKNLKYLILFNIYALLAGTSSASYIAFIIGMIFIGSSSRHGIKIQKIIVVCLISLLLYQTMNEIIFDFVFRGKSEDAIANGTGRFEIWEAAFKAWEASPILGHGFLVGERSLWKFGLGLMVVSAHNSFISVLVNTGIAGTIIFAYFWVKWTWTIYKISHKNIYAIILLPVIAAIFVNCNAFPAIGSDWNYVSPSIYALIAFSFINLSSHANHLDYKKFHRLPHTGV